MENYPKFDNSGREHSRNLRVGGHALRLDCAPEGVSSRFVGALEGVSSRGCVLWSETPLESVSSRSVVAWDAGRDDRAAERRFQEAFERERREQTTCQLSRDSRRSK